jgi:hypothetical protein
MAATINRDRAPSRDKRRGPLHDPEKGDRDTRARSSMKAEANGHQASIRRRGNVTDLTLDAGCRPAFPVPDPAVQADFHGSVAKLRV